MVLDVETFGLEPANGKLLGIALCAVGSTAPAYVVLQWYDFQTSTWHLNLDYEALRLRLAAIAAQHEFLGHNYAFDKKWFDSLTGYDSKWHACTRLMWHMASAPLGPRPYGLKDAQVEVLGWAKKGDLELEEQVRARGGKLKEGGHYLADLDVLGKYACLDALSTVLLYEKLSPFYNTHDYWWLLKKMVRYSWLLQECTDSGIRVDVDRLIDYVKVLKDTKEAYTNLFMELAHPHIDKLERLWRDHRAAKYSSDAHRQKFLQSWDLHRKFKLSSDKDKRELFYEALGLPIVTMTEGGKPSTSIAALTLAWNTDGRPDVQELLEAVREADSAETILNSFAKPWLDVVKKGRIHPRYNPCGTVSYRLSGFKPYFLNAPFDEAELMACFTCDEGWEGVHADFAALEPTVTAHYSQDPSLLKVFKHGLGDVYLDLALTLFPNDQELSAGYNPRIPVTSEVKERFKKQRKVAKIIHLAVQYTGTKYTVSSNLCEAGAKTTLAEADELVKACWRHFKKVAVMNEAIFQKNIKNGFLRNVVGRIIRVPYPRYKDLPNRVIQSSHDLLSFWVMKIDEKVRALGIPARPVLIDCHDSTSWVVDKNYTTTVESIFRETLQELNEEVRMSVPVKIEMKRFQTLAGLKGTDV